MGNNNSSTRSLPYDGSQYPFGEFSNQVFWQEETSSLLQSSENIVPFKNNVDSVHPKDDLAYLILGCYEQLHNLPQILEAIITNDKKIDNPIILNAQKAYYLYRRSASIRSIVYLSNKDFRKKFYSPFLFCPSPVARPEIPTFTKIINAISSSISLLSGQTANIQDIISVVNFFNNCTTSSSYPSPTVDFLPKNKVHNELFTAPYVMAHGISSNGQFLFVLCADSNLKVFPLLNSGGLSAPISHKLPIKFERNASLVAGPNTIRVFQGKYIYDIPIGSLIPATMTPIVREPVLTDSEFISVASDGLCYVTINHSFVVNVHEVVSHKLLRSFSLKMGFCGTNQRIPELFPSTDYNMIPTLINGSFLGFIFRIDQEISIFRVFSLITGVHIYDEVFSCPDQMYASITDMFNKCTWSIVLMDNARLGVKRFYFPGSCDPLLLKFDVYNPNPISKVNTDNAFVALNGSLSTHLLHYIGTQIFPRLFIADSAGQLQQLIDLNLRLLSLTNLKSNQIVAFVAAIQNILVLLDVNVLLFEQVSDDPNIRENLLNLVTSLPINLSAYIFFNHFPFLMRGYTNKSISVFIGILDRIEDDSIIQFCMSRIEASPVLAILPVSQQSAFIDLIPSFNNNKPLKKQMISLLLLHQQVLTSNVERELHLNPFIDIQVISKNKGNVPPCVANFADYTQILIAHFDLLLSQAKSLKEIESSIVFVLFNNYFKLLSSLTEFHTVARMITALLVLLFPKLKSRIDTTDSSGNPSLFLNMVFQVIFIFSQFAATLVKGGGLSAFEEKFVWLVKSNIVNNKPQYFETLPSPLLENIDSIDHMNFILNPGSSMQEIYKKYKSSFNRKLNENIQEIDRISATAFSKHLNVFSELKGFNNSSIISEDLRIVLDQMLRIRNEYRSLVQNSKENEQKELRTKCLMLLRMKSDYSFIKSNPQVLSDFVIDNTPPQTIAKILQQQPSRVSTTLVGFSFIISTYNENIHPVFESVIAFSLSQIEYFNDLGTIIQSTQLTESQMSQIESFFLKCIEIISKTETNELVIMIFRFFRDIRVLSGIQSNLFDCLFSLYSQNTKRTSLFSLVLSLIHSSTTIPAILQNFSGKYPTLYYILLSECLKSNDCSISLFDSFDKHFWNANPLLSRLTCRVMYHMLSSKSIPSTTIENQIRKMIKNIGTMFLEYQFAPEIAEMIWILRRILFEDHPACQILQNLLLQANISDQVYMCGVFAILGSYIEPLRPYCSVRYHQNRHSSEELIAIPQDKGKSYLCYSRPFSLTDLPRRITALAPSQLYAIPIVSVDPDLFKCFEFVLGFFRFVHSDGASMVTKSLYYQLLAHFAKSPDFVKQLNDDHIKAISECPLPFSDIIETVQQIESFKTLPKYDEVCGFSQISFRTNEIYSYLSPQIAKDCPKFSVKINYSEINTNAFIGIVTSNVDKIHTRYSLIHIPSGNTYPVGVRNPQPPSDEYTSITMSVDMSKKEFQVGRTVQSFPVGSAFRIIIAQKKHIPLQIDIPQAATVFVEKPVPPQQSHGSIDSDVSMSLFTMPEWIRSYKKAMPFDYASLPKSDLIIGTLDIPKKLNHNFINPPYFISLHVGFASQASQKIIDEQIRGLYKQIACQWSTILLMRVIRHDQSKIRIPSLTMKMFSLLVVQLESFSPSEFVKGKFPFSLDEPIWNMTAESNLLYYSLENECKEALRNIVKEPSFIDQLCHGLRAMVKSEAMHLIARPSRFHVYSPPGVLPINYEVQSPMALIVPNSFKGPIREAATIGQSLVPFPVIINSPRLVFGLKPSTIQSEVSLFKINAMDNTWVFDTAFELLLLLKNLAFTCSSLEQKTIAKTILIECFIVQSPFIYLYLSQFADHIQVQVPTTPLDHVPSYQQLLLLLGSLISSRDHHVVERFKLHYLQEQRVLTSQLSASMIPYFPEFFSNPPPRPESNKCSIPIVSVDPGAIDSNFASHVLMLRLFSRSYKSLIGFPFWEILPYWYRINDIANGGNDYIEPTISLLSVSVLHLVNPTRLRIELKLTPKGRGWSADSLVLRSNTSDFHDPDYIMPADLSNPILSSDADIYISLISVQGGFENCTYTLKNLQPRAKNTEPKSGQVDISLIREKFINDMRQFAVLWNDSHTEQLINHLPRIALREQTFTTAYNISQGSSLCGAFSNTVVALKALIIHHYNYLRNKHLDKVPISIWESMNRYMSSEDAADKISEAIIKSPDNSFPVLTIDRHSAHRLIVDGVGNPSQTILHQLAVIFKQNDPRKFQCRQRPWKISFVGENAIDAGGPTREVLTESCSSFFEPTSRLAIPVPNALRHSGPNQDKFIPFDTLGNRPEDYYAIGFILGIVLRTGLSQDLPFAPLVWRYLAKEKITLDDIVTVDKFLGDHINHMRDVKNDPEFSKKYIYYWTVETWNGKSVCLPGHRTNSIIDRDEIETYVREVVQFRIDTILPYLKNIRRGFRVNIGFKHHPLMTGPLLSLMAQGCGIISVEHLKSITQIYDFDQNMNNPYIVRFWNAVNRLTSEQRKLLLKFITTLTRLPNTSINPDFVIKIDRLNCSKPDQTLPTASTCFNKLHLPEYSNDEIAYQKIVIAIQYCQTMENS